MSGFLNGQPFGQSVQRVFDPSGALLEIKRVAINASTIGDNTLVAAVTAKKILVVSMHFICSAAVGVRFESGAGGTALSGVMSYPANGGIALNFNSAGWYQTAAGALLNMELSVAASAVVSGSLQYVEVD